MSEYEHMDANPDKSVRKKMKRCECCGTMIAKSARACPSCGAKNKKPFYKRWWFWLLVVVVIVGLVGSSGSDEKGGDASAGTDTPTESVPVDEGPALTAEEWYQSILDDYSEKLRAAVPGLVEEYKSEAAGNTSGLEGLAKLSNDKVEELAAICNEGGEEMAKVMYTAGSGSYDEYEAWAGKLYDVYEEEAAKIMDAYMDSAM